jgi:predicted RecB family nuclease
MQPDARTFLNGAESYRPVLGHWDVSTVRPQGGHVATQCAVRAQNNVLRPCEPLASAPEVLRRFERGRAFEEMAVTSFEASSEDLVVTAAGTEDVLELATASAMKEGAEVIFNGQLPTDGVGRRVGRPDVLVRDVAGGYRPVDIKHHMALEPSGGGGGGLPARCSSLDAPRLDAATVDDQLRARKRETDLLQLAHYQRMLEAADMAPTDGRWGGIIGTEEKIVWYDLDAPIWLTSSSSGQQGPRTTMEHYDFEFGFRLEVIAAAEAHRKDPSVELLVVPVLIGECAACPWRDYCGARLAAGSGDVSLIPRVGQRHRQIHADHGVTDRDGLARLDPRTARLVSSGADILDMQSLTLGLPAETPISDLAAVVRSKKQLAALAAEGVLTFADLARLPGATAAYGDAMSTLPEQIDLARAALGPAPIYRRRGVEVVRLPRADIEVDVDMESVETGVYLWGALLTDRSTASTTFEYQAFSVWGPLDAAAEAANSLDFWAWMAAVRADATKRGLSFRAYCYNASAENQYLRRLGLVGNILGDVNAFIDSDQWVDLLKVVNDQFITGGGMGLKKVGPLSGFTWEVEDPGGGFSMVQYDIAVNGETDRQRDDARSWLITYNRGDVEATLSIRDWLERDGGKIPTVESLDEKFSSQATKSGAAL